MDATNAVDELLDAIAGAIADLEPKERIMVLCTVSDR